MYEEWLIHNDCKIKILWTKNTMTFFMRYTVEMI
jgi:hypothetical protein